MRKSGCMPPAMGIVTDTVEDPFNLEAMAAGINYNNAIFKLISGSLDTSANVLDFGAGTGTFANRIPFPITCLEPDPGSSLNISSNHTVISAIDESQHEYDFIYSINVLEHIDDDIGALRQMFDYLSPGGRLLLFVPACMELYSAMDERARHVRRYRSCELITKVRDIGFDVTNCRYFDCLGYPATLVVKYLGKAFSWQGGLNQRSVKKYDRCFFPLSNIISSAIGQYVPGKNLILTAVKSAHRC